MKGPPLACVPAPHHVEARFNAFRRVIEARKARIEFFALIFGEPRAKAHDETVTAAAPFAENIDWIVEFGGLNFWEEFGLQNAADKTVASGGYGRLFLRAERFCHYPYALPFRP